MFQSKFVHGYITILSMRSFLVFVGSFYTSKFTNFVCTSRFSVYDRIQNSILPLVQPPLFLILRRQYKTTSNASAAIILREFTNSLKTSEMEFKATLVGLILFVAVSRAAGFEYVNQGKVSISTSVTYVIIRVSVCEIPKT